MDVKSLQCRSLAATIGSCTCLTKSPEASFHKPNCRYRVITELRAELFKTNVPGDGPSKRIFHHCAGCKHLKTKDWKFYGENDEVDRGTDATCSLVGKSIATYWHSGYFAPNWCPYLQ